MRACHALVRRSGLVFLTVVLLATASRADDLKVDGHVFNVPEGFTVERTAGPPLVDRPITIDFDERGRLYVAESSGTNDPVQKQLAERPHRILRLEDTDGDGQFDRRTVYADQLMFPEGTLWYAGSLYVTAPPQIWKFTDTDDDGVADRREVWFDGKTLTGCANDLHGPYLGPDGYIYWCKGAFAEQTYPHEGKPDFKTRAAHIFRRRADGTGPVEPVMTGGMDNPVDVVFTAEGERIFSCTFLVHPGGGQRDGLIHAISGGIYGKDHDPIHDPVHKWTSPETMPVLVHLGPAAPAGLTRYESEIFGSEYRDNLFACCFNMHKVTRHVLSPKGSTYEASNEDFLTSPDVDFHPTDVLEDADGSLLVVNTGGWYKLCCPTSQLHKPDVLGAIYRIRRVGAPKVEDPRGNAIDWATTNVDHLAALLDDPRPRVVRRAIETIVARPAETVLPVLKRKKGIGVIWAASRIDHPDARGLLATAAFDTNPSQRTAARNALSTLRPEHLLEVANHVAQDFGREPIGEELAALALGDASDASRRAGAVLLARAGAHSAVPAILDALARENDRPLDHALTFALIEIAERPGTSRGLSHSHPRVRRAAMVALDQMGAADRLDPAQVAAWMSDPDPQLRASAAWVVGRHSEWGGPLANFFRQQLQKIDLEPVAKEQLASQLAGLATGEEIQSLLATTAANMEAPNHKVALAAMAAADLKTLPADWATVLNRLIAFQVFTSGPTDQELLDQALAGIKGRDLPEGPGQEIVLSLNRLGRGEIRAWPDSTRLAALGCLPKGLREVDDGLFGYLRSRLEPDQPVAVRLAASDVLVHAGLSPDQLKSLAEVLRTAGPLEVTRLLPAFQNCDDAEVGLALIAALEASEGATTLRAEQLDPILTKFPDAVRGRAHDFVVSHQIGAAEQAARLGKLLESLPAGEAGRGHQVFAGAKAACSSCHAMGYLGGRVGPDLTKIGQIRTDRDLLEAIVYPSASFVRSYEPVTVATLDGRIVSGTVRKDAPDELVLTIAADKEERIARSEIEEIRPGTVSIMPAGLDQQLTPQELADLLAFLKAAR